jgi:ABC-type thiamine transport system substrate-binding protein
MFLAKTEDSVKFECMQKFVKFLTNEKNQLKVANMNMFPTTKIEFLMQNKYLKTIKIENLENIFINNAFIEISEIKKLQQTK